MMPTATRLGGARGEGAPDASSSALPPTPSSADVAVSALVSALPQPITRAVISAEAAASEADFVSGSAGPSWIREGPTRSRGGGLEASGTAGSQLHSAAPTAAINGSAAAGSGVESPSSNMPLRNGPPPRRRRSAAAAAAAHAAEARIAQAVAAAAELAAAAAAPISFGSAASQPAPRHVPTQQEPLPLRRDQAQPLQPHSAHEAAANEVVGGSGQRGRAASEPIRLHRNRHRDQADDAAGEPPEFSALTPASDLSAPLLPCAARGRGRRGGDGGDQAAGAAESIASVAPRRLHRGLTLAAPSLVDSAAPLFPSSPLVVASGGHAGGGDPPSPADRGRRRAVSGGALQPTPAEGAARASDPLRQAASVVAARIQRKREQRQRERLQLGVEGLTVGGGGAAAAGPAIRREAGLLPPVAAGCRRPQAAAGGPQRQAASLPAVSSGGSGGRGSRDDGPAGVGRPIGRAFRSHCFCCF